jgi:hypothetical protein
LTLSRLISVIGNSPLLWYYIPDFFRSHPDRQDPSWFPWGLVAATAWSIAAVPMSIISVYVFGIIRKRTEIRK